MLSNVDLAELTKVLNKSITSCANASGTHSADVSAAIVFIVNAPNDCVVMEDRSCDLS